MGNCQAIDNASFVLQHQNGKAERFYSAIAAGEIMKLHPGHYVALLLTTTVYSSDHRQNNSGDTTATQPLRVTRIKLLRPTDNLALGHAYRLITTQEVMKGLKAKKNGKSSNRDNIKNLQCPSEFPGKNGGCEAAETRSNQLGKTHPQMRKLPEKLHRQRAAAPANSSGAGAKPRGWHPSLKSISEATN